MYTNVVVSQGGVKFLENGTGASIYPNIAVTGKLQSGKKLVAGQKYLIVGQPLLDTNGIFKSERPSGTYNFENVE